MYRLIYCGKKLWAQIFIFFYSCLVSLHLKKKLLLENAEEFAWQCLAANYFIKNKNIIKIATI